MKGRIIYDTCFIEGYLSKFTEVKFYSFVLASLFRNCKFVRNRRNFDVLCSGLRHIPEDIFTLDPKRYGFMLVDIVVWKGGREEERDGETEGETEGGKDGNIGLLVNPHNIIF